MREILTVICITGIIGCYIGIVKCGLDIAKIPEKLLKDMKIKR